jgi:phosphoglucomutase
MLVDLPKLITAYYTERPDPGIASQRVAFGTSGHRGNSFERSFNEAHVLAITQAICGYRKQKDITGPLFLGFDTHALSAPAFASALEVLAANEVEVLIARNDEYTPTPAISQAILVYNRGRQGGLADGVVISPSHNPPDNGGFKYNPTNGGPADTQVTSVIEAEANRLLAANLAGVKRIRWPPRARQRPRTNTIFSASMWRISRTSSTSRPSAIRSCAWASIRSAVPACATGRRSPSATSSTSPSSTTRSMRRSGS